MRITERINDLFDSGVSEFDGVPVTSTARDRALEMAQVASDVFAPPDAVFATEDGGYTLGWGRSCELTVTVSPNGELDLHHANISGGTWVSETIPAERPAHLLRANLLDYRVKSTAE